MNSKLIFGAAAILTAAAIYSSPLVLGTNQAGSDAEPIELANPTVELPVELVFAQAFELAQPATHFWRLEQPTYTSGLLLVLSADAELLAPRQVAEPVLYVGSQTAERLNAGSPSGQLVVLVPDMTLEELADAPIFFGQAELPERIDASRANAELQAAKAQGITGPGQARVDQASREAVNSIGAADADDLHFQASFVIEAYSPDEKDLISGLRVERL